MSSPETILGAGALVLGFFFTAMAAVGVARLPDVYCRAHALGKAMTLGIMFLLIATGLLVPGVSWFKLFVAIVFQFVTIPVASHLLCLVAHRRGIPSGDSLGPEERGPTGGKKEP